MTEQTIDKVVSLADIRPWRYQNRTTFDLEKMGELARSIMGQGLIHPPIVTAVNSHYELLAGERRWRASCAIAMQANGVDPERALAAVCKAAPDPVEYPFLKQTTMRVKVDSQSNELEQRFVGMVDNLQRANLDPVEEGAGYQSLLDGGAKLDWIIARTGKPRRHIEARLRLGKLAEPVKAHIKAKRIPLGVVESLLTLPAETQIEVADKMIGRKAEDIERVIKMVKVPSLALKEEDSPHSGPLPKGNGDAKKTIVELKALASFLLHCLREDNKLLARCADALAQVDYDLAEAAFMRANEMDKAIRNNFDVSRN